VKVKDKASPFDPNLRDYWEDRRKRRLVREAGHFLRIHLTCPATRHRGQTLSGPFSITYEPHRWWWMFTGES
jgi:hypothetical protein